jgi:ribonuclease PH
LKLIAARYAEGRGVGKGKHGGDDGAGGGDGDVDGDVNGDVDDNGVGVGGSAVVGVNPAAFASHINLPRRGVFRSLRAMLIRPDNREADQLRPISFQPGIAPHAAGSVLAAFGDTRVICAATLEERVPTWMKQQGIKGGWLTAEYSLLPYSTLDRKPRDIAKGRLDGRTVEIQRLIGRALRAVLDLSKLDGFTLWIDCDVLQADGGTRTASISGAYVAAQIAIKKFLAAGKLRETPFTDSVAAISAGVYLDTPVLDLNYLEDKDAAVDANIVMTGGGKFVEVQSSGEEATFDAAQLQALIDLARAGLGTVFRLQQEAIAAGG